MAPSNTAPPSPGLTPEEQEIYKRLHDKAGRNQAAEELKKRGEKPADKQFVQWYKENMRALQKYIN
jgi:hypothetical protein